MVFVGSVSIRGTENYIAFAMVGDCDVSVAAACLDWESPGVVSVALCKWDGCDVEFNGEGQFGGLAYWIDAWCLSGWCV